MLIVKNNSASKKERILEYYGLSAEEYELLKDKKIGYLLYERDTNVVSILGLRNLNSDQEKDIGLMKYTNGLSSLRFMD